MTKLLLLGLGLLLAICGQSILSFDREHTGVGIAAYASSLIVLFVLVRVAREEQRLMRVELRLIQLLSRADRVLVFQCTLVFVAVVCIWITIAIAQSTRQGGEYWPAFYAWLAALLALATALVFVPARRQIRRLGKILANARHEVLAVIGLTSLALLLRAIDLTNIPYPFTGDEGSIGLEGRHILSGQISHMFITSWQSESSMSFLPWALSMAAWGQTIFGLRIFAALVGALTIPLLYLLVRSMFERPMAVLSAGLLAVMSTHIHFSRLAVNNIENPFLACLVFGLIYRALETRQVYWFAAAGLASGLAIYSFAGSRLVAILAGVYLIYALSSDKSMWREWPKFVLFGLVAGLVVSPLAIFFWQNPNNFWGRVNQLGAFQSGWVEREIETTGLPVALIMGNQFSRSFFLFVSAPALQGFYDSPRPMFDPLWSLFLILGIIFSLFNLRERRQVLLQLWFWSVILFAGALLQPPPQVERFVMAFPVVAIFIAWGIWSIVALLTDALGTRPAIQRALLAVSGITLAVTSMSFYFFEYTPRHYFTSPNGEVGVELGQYLATVPRDSRVYFLGEPRMFYGFAGYGFASIEFLSGGLEGVDVRPRDDVERMVQPNRKAIFIALPERREDLERIRQLYSHGTYWQVSRPTKLEEILYLVYTVEP